MAWATAALLVLVLGSDVLHDGTSINWLRSALLTAALVAAGCTVVLSSRYGSATALFGSDPDGAQQSAARYRQIFETANEGIVTMDTRSAITTANQQAADMLGYSTDELVGRRFLEFSDAAATDVADDEVEHVQQPWTGERETALRDKDGALVSVLVHESPLIDSEGRYEGQLGMITNLTERRGFEDELEFRSLHDDLTGLPNRLLLVDRLQLALGRSSSGGRGVAVVFIDIDDFKNVNGTLGHDAADQLLSEIATRLSNSVRERDTVARFGGNEFVVICEGQGEFAERLAVDLRDALSLPWSVGDGRVTIAVSMGVTLGHNGDRPGSLLRDADMAMLQAKANGGNRTEFFTQALQTTSRKRLTMVSDLRRAVARHEFSLRFQPVVSLTDGSILGAEALVRWEHPHRGTISPGDFIAVAEEAGFIDAIGQWVIEETCVKLAAWQKLIPDLSVSLNISPLQLTSGVLNGILRNAITSSDVNPAYLALEITESVLVDDVEVALEALNCLRETGVTISIDDFGTGYSSLSYLQKFPVDILKIDQSFVAGLPDSACETALVQAILAIAQALDLSVVAEGVETADQATILRDLGCQRAQGYYFYRPLTAEDFEAQLSLVAASRVKPDDRDTTC